MIDNKLKVQETQELHPKDQNGGLIILKGITTSQINQAPKADNPYPTRVFLKTDNQEQDIPVFFRIKEKGEEVWIRPKIKTNSLVEVQGKFSIGTVYTKNGERKSFTAYSYKLLACPHSQKKPFHCPQDCPCLKGQELKNKTILQQAQDRFPYWKSVVQKLNQDFITKKEELNRIKNE